MRFSSVLLLLIAVVLVGQSCKKKKEDCAFIAPRMVFNNFSEDESDTMIIRKYEAASGFSKLIDTTLISRAVLTRTTLGNDSVAINTNNKAFNNQFYSYNWELVIPGAGGKVVRFSDIIARFTQEVETSAQCQSYVSSMNQDGSQRVFATWFVDSYNLFIVK
jgi:hypothetical protein